MKKIILLAITLGVGCGAAGVICPIIDFADKACPFVTALLPGPDGGSIAVSIPKASLAPAVRAQLARTSDAGPP